MKHLWLDCNCWYGRPPRPPFRYAATPAELLAQMDHSGIGAGLVYHVNQRFGAPSVYDPLTLKELRPHQRLFPVRTLMPPQTGELPAPEALLAELHRDQVRAMRAFPCEHRYQLNALTFGSHLEMLAAHHIPLLVKADCVAIGDLLRDIPDLTVVAMSQGPHSVERYLRPLLDRFPNLHLDTSGLLVEGLIEEFTARYGSKRLLFGSNCPDNAAGGSRQCLAQADIAVTDRTRIAGGNLRRLLEWAGPLPDMSDVSDLSDKSDLADSCSIIDMHGHWGEFPGAYLPAADEARMLAAMDRGGVRSIVCSSHEALIGDFERGNRAMQQAIERYPGRILGYWAVNPHHDASWKRAPTDLDAANGFIGFKFLPDYHAYPADGPNYAPALTHADANRLCVMIHTWGGSAYNSPRHVERLAREYPNARLIMGHAGYGDWGSSARLASDFPNVYLDLTAVYAAHDFSVLPAGSGTPSALGSCLHVNGVIEFLVERAGSDKILFGTDLPWYDPQYAAGAVLFADLSPSDRRRVFHDNAAALLSASDMNIPPGDTA